jgi:hypothetical protein
VAAVDFVEVALEESPNNQVTFGSAVTPNRKSTNKLYLPSRTALLSPAPDYLSRADELRGIAGSVADLIDSYTPEGSLSERAYWKDLTWLLSLAGFTGVVTAGNGVITDPDAVVIPAGGPQRWVFTKKTGITAQTAQIILNYANEAVKFQGNGFGISKLDLNAAGELSADLLGCYLQRLAVDTTTVPSLVSSAIPPLRRGDLTLTWLTGSGTPDDFSFSIENPLEGAPGWLLSPASFFPSSLEFAGDQQVRVTGSVPKRVLDADDIDALLNASTFAAKARWKSQTNIAATGYKYSFWVEMPACQYTGGDADEITNRRRRGASFDWYAAWDEVSGYDVKFTLVNDVTAIATYV